ncbi:hypothetical protein CDAR_414841 [Caerostris darwini]|uniref:Uncharacterized protein n=1 Tax=Caerostris darwini TaxID=1538125 RepID=A0AAV4RDK1_9ARAC|nr:hypothetical protein CDAR_414841 [Caerostris darwini]
MIEKCKENFNAAETDLLRNTLLVTATLFVRNRIPRSVNPTLSFQGASLPRNNFSHLEGGTSFAPVGGATNRLARGTESVQFGVKSLRKLPLSDRRSSALGCGIFSRG